MGLDMTLKMIDFGLANKHGRGRPGSRRGSQRSAGSAASSSSPPSSPMKFDPAPAFQVKGKRYGDLRDQFGLCCLAPEQLGNGVDAKADVWAIGVLSYFLLSG